MDNLRADPEIRATYIRLLLEKGDAELWQRAVELHSPAAGTNLAEMEVARYQLECAQTDLSFYTQMYLRNPSPKNQQKLEIFRLKHQIALAKYNASTNQCN
jgi:hypothetical protein